MDGRNAGEVIVASIEGWQGPWPWREIQNSCDPAALRDVAPVPQSAPQGADPKAGLTPDQGGCDAQSDAALRGQSGGKHPQGTAPPGTCASWVPVSGEGDSGCGEGGR